MKEKRNLLEEMGNRVITFHDMLAQQSPEEAWPLDAMASYFKLVKGAKEAGKTLVWINFATIPELFWAMDMIPVSIDTLNAFVITAPGGQALKYIDIAEQYLPDYVCGLHKIAFGAMMEGDMPIPNLMVTPTAPCDSGLSTYPMIAEHFGIPHFYIDVPYERDERSSQYLANELRRLVSFLEEQTKRKLDFNRLKQVMEYSNRAHEINGKLLKLEGNVPCPVSSLDMIGDNGMMLSMAGTQWMVDRLEKRYEQAEDRVSKKQGHLAKENLRLVWSYGSPMFDQNIIFPYLEQKYGAINAQILMNFDYEPPKDISDIDKIYRSLAQKVFATPMTRECGGHSEYYMDRLINLVKNFKADGVVFGGHVACQRGWALSKLLTDKVYDELGISTLNFELDFYDPRITSMETIKAKLHDFITVVLKKNAIGE